MITQNEQHDQSQITANHFSLYTDIKYDLENILNLTMLEKTVNI